MLLLPLAFAAPWTFADASALLDRGAASTYAFDALFADYNQDGRPDLHLVDHAGATTSDLWMHDGDGYVWVDPATSGHAQADPVSPGGGWAAYPVDLDGDGDQDFIGVDAGVDAALYPNTTPVGEPLPTFGPKASVCAVSDYCMVADIDGVLEVIPAEDTFGLATDLDADGIVEVVYPGLGGYYAGEEWVDAGLVGGTGHIVAADLDADGDLDLLTGTGDHEVPGDGAHLYRNDEGTFTEVTTVTPGWLAWWTIYSAAAVADLDNDGDFDLLFGGAAYDPSVTFLRNDGDFSFVVEDTDLGGAAEGSSGSKARHAVGDFDADGFLDVWKVQAGPGMALWRNTTANGNHWLRVRVRGEGGNTDAIGATVWVGGVAATVQTNYQHAPLQPHFGLGDRDAAEVTVQWPHGERLVFADIPVDREIVVYPDGCVLTDWEPWTAVPLVSPADCTLVATDPRGDATPCGCDTTGGGGPWGALTGLSGWYRGRRRAHASPPRS